MIRPKDILRNFFSFISLIRNKTEPIIYNINPIHIKAELYDNWTVTMESESTLNKGTFDTMTGSPPLYCKGRITYLSLTQRRGLTPLIGEVIDVFIISNPAIILLSPSSQHLTIYHLAP